MITLASDFGSVYPAAMRGVLARECDARLEDVAHDLPRQDVRAAAFWLRFVLAEFPPAVHLVVVDPGVGTDRDALVVRVGDHALVGPDNGVLLPPARALAERQGLGGDDGTDADAGADADGAVEAFVLDHPEPDSTTFHGRDVFAPAAAQLYEAGVDHLPSLPDLDPTDDPVDLRLPAASVDADGADGEVLVVDDFGNAITNVPGDAVRGRESVSVDGERVPVGRSFAAVAPGDRLVTVGSHGYAECDVNRGRGAEAFGLAPGDAVRFDF
ncbi:S-adenosyl-l-methionine hydroxide adenosyltransferase family protein [Halobium salinum]|uniref:S-adenosyl-l-methionine hydroxide adenosyltransferase family protein n=1 Tax=Halobium salinum TaxID=1364940 RepID=A0ABD5PH74_9EURY|nr:SAM-dependent chlorinase/fluorinase [Halobium salinum]